MGFTHIVFLCDFILDDSSGVFWGLSDKILHCVTGPFVHWLMLFALLSDQNTPEWTLRDCSLVFNDDLTSINSTLEPFCVFHEVAMHQSVHVIDLDATCSFSKMEHPIRCVLVRLCDQTMRAACDDLKHRVSLDRQLQFLVRRAVEEAIVHRCDSGLIQGGFFWVGMHGEIGSNSVGSSGFAAVSGSGSWGFVGFCSQTRCKRNLGSQCEPEMVGISTQDCMGSCVEKFCQNSESLEGSFFQQVRWSSSDGRVNRKHCSGDPRNHSCLDHGPMAHHASCVS